MPMIPLRDNIYWVGVNDRTTDLFEGLWPITNEGVSYNSYLINDEKKVLIDLAKSIKSDEFFAQMGEIFEPQELDYVVINHMEPDHTGILRLLRRIAPNVTILTTAKAKDMLANFYDIVDNVQVVKDGETLDLGQRKLTFVSTPFVHWPETMMTYESTEKILFACDGFGGYGALPGTIFDDGCCDLAFYERESLRYYVNIVARFHVSVLKAIDKLKNVPVSMIAPSHGLIWRKNPERIIELYRYWSELAKRPGEAGVTLLYGSMYGNTEAAMNAVAQGLSNAGVGVEVFDVARIHSSYILPSLWVHRGVMIGAPTYEAGLFPPMADLLTMAERKAIRNKQAAYFGSYAWSGGALKELEGLLATLKWELADSFSFAGGATLADRKAARDFGYAFGSRIRDME
jgi:flavorubredoxin